MHIGANTMCATQAGANEGGFWYAGERPKSVSELLNEYEDSVGHNSNMMLEISPDRDGAVPPGDADAYVAFGEALRRCYRGPGAQAPAANASATSSVVPTRPRGWAAASAVLRAAGLLVSNISVRM